MSDWNVVRETAEHDWPVGPTVYQAALSYYDHRMEFEVYRACRATDGTLAYTDFDYHQKEREKRGDATPWVEGSVKWDGCCNFSLDNGGTMAHICCVTQMAELAAVFAKLYEAAKRIPNWAAELAALAEVFEYDGRAVPAVSVRPRESDPPAPGSAADNPEG